MSIHRHSLALLSVLLLLSASLVHTTNKLKLSLELRERIQNDQWQKMQKDYITAMEAKAATPIAAPDESLVNYKAMVFNLITSKGADPDQIKLVSGQLTESRAPSFLEMSRYIPKTDDPKRFFGDEPYTTLIKSIPQSGYTKAVPWSSTHWPTRNGGISVRYCWSHQP